MKKLSKPAKSFFLIFVFTISSFTRGQVIELKFKRYPDLDSDTSKNIRSLIKVRDISEQYSTGGLYLMRFKGDFNELFQNENQKAIDFPMITEAWRFCSVFSTRTGNTVIMGRNWDNQNVGSIIVSLYEPLNGYSSVSFTRAIDMDFPLNVDLEGMISSPFAKKLLLTPFYANDGINEHGLCIAVSGTKQEQIKAKSGKELVFITFFIRKVLDNTKTVEEAISLTENYIPFDLDKNLLNCHFYIADSSGRSVILEYHNDKWEKIFSDTSWQIMTNKFIFGESQRELKEKCWHYNKISETLERTNGIISWQNGIELLKNVSQKGTTWSVIYSPSQKDLFFSVYQSWDKIYHLQGF